MNGRDLVATVEHDRWATKAFEPPGKTNPGAAYTFAAGSIGDVSKFDAEFFGISPREAALMDPQFAIDAVRKLTASYGPYSISLMMFQKY